MEEFPKRVVLAALVALAVGGVLGWLQRRIDAAVADVDVERRQLVLRYGPLLRVVLPWVSAAFAIGGVLLALFTWPTERERALVHGSIIVVIFGCGAVVTLLATRSIVRYDEEGVIGKRPGGGQTVISWSEIERVTYSRLWHGVVLNAPQNRRITVSLYMNGAADFLAAVRKQVERKRRRHLEDGLARHREL